jgi:hypothetical protein
MMPREVGKEAHKRKPIVGRMVKAVIAQSYVTNTFSVICPTNQTRGRMAMRVGLGLIASAMAIAVLGGPASAQEMDLMQFADANNDGKVTPEEFAAFREQGWNFFSQGAEKVKLADLDPMAKGAFIGVKPDAEGNATKQTYLAVTSERFKAADKNGDGTLDHDELNNSVKPAS